MTVHDDAGNALHMSYSAMHRNSPYPACNTTLPTGRKTKSKFYTESEGIFAIS